MNENYNQELDAKTQQMFEELYRDRKAKSTSKGKKTTQNSNSSYSNSYSASSSTSSYSNNYSSNTNNEEIGYRNSYSKIKELEKKKKKYLFWGIVTFMFFWPIGLYNFYKLYKTQQEIDNLK